MTDENTLSIIERAEKLNKETMEAEERINKARAEIMELETKRVMGGKSNVEPSPVVKEETPKEYADRVMRNSIK
jgi:hypothetical protein